MPDTTTPYFTIIPSLANGRSYTIVGRVVKPCFDKHTGYNKIILTNTVDKKSCFIHRLVAQAFIPNPDNKPQVNHKDGNKLNNRVENLEWVTISENSFHKYRVLRSVKFKDRKGKSSTCSKKVIQSTLHKQLIKVWDSQGDIQRALGFSQSDISRACKKGNTSHGYLWSHLNNQIEYAN